MLGTAGRPDNPEAAVLMTDEPLASEHPVDLNDLDGLDVLSSREIERLRAENEALASIGHSKNERIEELSARVRWMASELESLASRDSLTGLATRRAFEFELARGLSRASQHGSHSAVLLIGLDSTRRINETLGHSAGDLVLKGVTKRMLGVLRLDDPICRIGGDEFLALLPNTELDDAVQVAERVRRAIADHPIELSGEPLEITASIAVASVPSSVVSIEEILDSMRATLVASKSEAPDRVAVAIDEAGVHAPGPNGSDEFDQLLERGSLRALAQSIRDLETGEITGYEMLSRGPKGPYESPIDLFRLARERRALARLDLRCMRTCVEVSRQLKPGLLINVNLCPSTLMDTPVSRILELFDEAGGAQRFCLELSEQQFLGAPDYLHDAVQELKRGGAKIALDDVGFGRSSLEALVLLQPDVIKIARECVDSSDRFSSRRAELGRLVEAAHALAPTLVAEGIEREGERRLCQDLGIEQGQGYLWDRPRNVHEVVTELPWRLRAG